MVLPEDTLPVSHLAYHQTLEQDRVEGLYGLLVLTPLHYMLNMSVFAAHSDSGIIFLDFLQQ